ncbi:MAG: 16S rRNA (adenine(1518)-N(6)/adenine(1519)-N(6))-dimethyltransferase RsmA [Ruminococcaceae bacterium]|nr:16S rRNA (adenine(1518)-N(6)/adenine(1519)-N(6))-dimethyltransferase RsmA [Oscillospiraceae bacterium]
MENLTDISVIKKICARYGFKFKKGFGQNFLCDEDIVNEIIYGSGINENTDVIEIGPGFGSLTQSLLKYAKSVTSIEIDSSLVPVLTDLFGNEENFTLINEDVLKLDLNEIIKSDNTVLVANLPYYITTPILTYLLEGRFNLKSVTVMVQKEVADRMVAPPGSKDYGAITCLIDYYSDSRIIVDVPKECFIPAPNVNSAVVKLDILSEPKAKPLSEKNMFKLIKASFNQRRKTFLNGVSNSSVTDKSKAELEEILIKSGYDANLRGETLSIEEFAELSDKIF